jgi:hypothetical protein
MSTPMRRTRSLCCARPACGQATTPATPKGDPHVAAITPTQVRKRLRERREASLQHRIVFVERHEHADAPHALGLLRARHERPRRRAAECSDEISPPKANAHLTLPREGTL